MKNQNFLLADSPKHWYLEDSPDQKATRLAAYIKQLRATASQQELLSDLKTLERMYGVKYNIHQTQDVLNDNSSLQRMKLNIIKSIVDTIFNKIGKNKPLPYFLTEGGNFDQRTKSERLTKFIEGIFHESGMFDKGKQVLRNALIQGTGVLKYFIKDNKFCFEIRKIADVLVDLREAELIKPTQFHEISRITRQKLIQKYPKFKAEIEMVDAAEIEDTEYDSNYAEHNDPNIVEVRESWVVGEKGIHTISIDNAILFEEPYENKHPKLIFFKWDRALTGFWGTGIAELIQSLQVELNKLLRTWQLSLHLGAVPKIWMQRGTKLPTAHMNNKIGTVCLYDGVKPESDNMMRVPPELLPAIEWVLNQTYQMTGVSMLSAQSLKPAGLNSGKALNTFNDIETERFITYGQKYEELFLEVADRIIEMCEELAEQGIEVEAKAHNDSGFEALKWSEVKIDREKFIMKAFPVSFFSTTPSAKLQEVGDLINMGLLDAKLASKLLDYPDLKAATKEMLGLDSVLEKYIVNFTKGQYIAPSPYIDLDYAQKKIQFALLEYEAEGLSENKLDLFRQFLTEIAAIKNMQVQQMEQQAEMIEAENAQKGISQEEGDLTVNPDMTSDINNQEY